MEQLNERDLRYVRITDFMAAIGRQPVRKVGDRLIYNAPYNSPSLYREYGIETRDKPTCVVDTAANRWHDSKWEPYSLSGNLEHLVNNILNTHDEKVTSKYLLDVMNGYCRENTLRLLPIPRVGFENHGNVMCMVLTPEKVSFEEFLQESDYECIKTDGNLSYYRNVYMDEEEELYEVIIDNGKDAWLDPKSGMKLGLEDFVSALIGEECRSEILWHIAEMLNGKTVIKEFGPSGCRIVPEKEFLDNPAIGAGPKQTQEDRKNRMRL